LMSGLFELLCWRRRPAISGQGAEARG